MNKLLLIFFVISFNLFGADEAKELTKEESEALRKEIIVMSKKFDKVD